MLSSEIKAKKGGECYFLQSPSRAGILSHEPQRHRLGRSSSPVLPLSWVKALAIGSSVRLIAASSSPLALSIHPQDCRHS